MDHRLSIINRRTLLAVAGAALVVGPLRAAVANATMPLWPDLPPGGGGPSGPVKRSATGAISNIASPSLEVFLPTHPSGAAMLVAAGGGYKHIEMATEAYPAAQWLAAHGITAFVLSYRLPSEGWTAGPLAPLQDAQRALRIIRANAAKYGIDRNQIGVLGFSAGGHLLGMAATRSGFASYPATDAIDRQSARSNVAALIYPVITLEPPYDHPSTRRVLIGDHPDAQLSAEWSVQTHVDTTCPPMFLVQAKDDPVSNPANTLIMAAACKRAGVSIELHRLTDGGHGFGMGHPGSDTADWPGWYQTWLDKVGIKASG